MTIGVGLDARPQTQKKIGAFSIFLTQGSHMLEKNLNIEGFLEIKFALKSARKSLKDP